MTNKTRNKRILFTVLLIVGIIIAFTIFIRDNSNRIYDQNEEYLSELTTQRAVSVNNLFSENLSFIESTAYLYGQSLTSETPSIAVIQEFEENSIFDMLRFIDVNGDNYTSSGVQANLSDRPYFKSGMSGESGLTYVAQSRVTGEHQIGFYAPVIYDGRIIGVMVGFYGEAYINSLLEYELFGYDGEGWLCQADGTIMGATIDVEYDNYFDYMRETGRMKASELQRMKAAFEEGETTAFIYTEDGIEATGYAAELRYEGWVLIRNFPPSASQQILNNANGEGIKLVMALIIIGAIYALAMAVDIVLEQRRVRAANRDANEVSTGVSRLFESFVGVDLNTGKYHYLQGRLPDDDWPREGSYEDLVRMILDRAPDEKDREAAEGFMSLESLREQFRTEDKLSVRLHINVANAEYLTYNFIVTQRENGEASYMVVGGQDVTTMYYQEEQDKRKLQEALTTAERASRAKTDFLFNMSHDLRTPMNAIIGYTELAQREGVSEEDMHVYFTKIDSSSKHLLSLINDILEMSRVESGKMTLEPVEMDITEVIRESGELFSSQMKEKGIAFTAEAKDIRSPWVLCDKNRLDRVILNLISNAYKFTPEGGEVSVTLCQIGETEETASFELRVKDSGIGMSKEFSEKLFTPFERERTSTVSGIQGTGLGLSITRSIMDLMGGTIAVDTEQGRGTEFTVNVTFPKAETHREEEPENTDESKPFDFSGISVLLVEDNEINREIASMILSQEGFVIDTAENGRIAVDKVEENDPGHYDLILMDVQMPVMDGYTATRTIRALGDPERARVPIVAMTANAFKEDVDAANEAGMDGHIAKPLDVHKMMSEIRRVLAENR